MSHTIQPLLEHERLAELRAAVRGEILVAEDEGYDEAAKIWNGAHDGYHPGVIVRCTGVADVLGSVAFARANHLPVARWWSPEDFERIADAGRSLGLPQVVSSPLTRSSYHARQAAAGAVPATTATSADARRADATGGTA